MHFKWIDQFDLFLLDFDGLLVDTEQVHFAAYQEMCRKRGFSLDWSFDKYCTIAHKDNSGLRETIYAEHPALYKQEPTWSVLYAEKKLAYIQLLKNGKITLMPGVESFLKTLAQRKSKRCVVTNSLDEHIKLIKHSLPILNTIPVWITREQYEQPKPAPDGYFKAIELLADPKDRIIGFEDTYRGLQALQATSAKPILVCPPKHPQLKENYIKGIKHFSSFEELASKSIG